MAEENQEKMTKFVASSAQDTTEEGDCSKLDVTQKIDSPVRTTENDPENLALVPEPTTLLQGSVKGKAVISEGTPKNTKSDESDTTVNSDIQGQPHQLGSKPNVAITKASSSSKRKLPPLFPNFFHPKAKMKAVVSDEHGHLHEVPLFTRPNVIGNRTLPLINPSGPSRWNLWRRSKEFSDEILATVLIELLKKMPMVSTNGGISDGEIITGFLYKYQNGATIVCACHGQFFSSAEFVKHAGGQDVDNPSSLIHIEFFSTKKD